MTELLSVSIYTLLIAYTGVGNVRAWAEQRLLAIPNERSSHTKPTPSGGGVAIVLATLFGILVFALLTRQVNATLWFVITGGLLVALISWFDDLYTMPIQARLGVHSLSALCIVLGVGAVHQIALPPFGTLFLGWTGFFVTLFWIIGLINAYNFMDGIDGLAGAQALITGLAWAWLGYSIQAPLVMAFGLFIAASSLGFLGYNWPPARIFMGDVGSAFLGYSFATLTILATRKDPRLACVGLLLLWPFIFDTGFTLIRRWRNKENIFLAHRSHLYQRLVIAGHSHRNVTLLYAILALAGVLLGLDWFYGMPGSTLMLVVGLPALAIALWMIVRYYEARQLKVTPALQ